MEELFEYHLWANQMFEVAQKSTRAAQEHRSGWKSKLFKWLKRFKKGAVSPEGEELVHWLKTEFKFVGFAPNIVYMMDRPRRGASKSDLKFQWVHTFGSPTGLFFHKKLPIAVIANPNLRFDESVLKEIDSNTDLKSLKDILGFVG